MKEIIFKTLFKKKTSATLLSRSGIRPSSSDIFILGMYMYIAGLTWKKAEKLNFDVFLIIWIKYFRLGDTILDEYPDIVDIYTIKDNINLSIKKDNFPAISLKVLEDKKRSQDIVVKYLSLVDKLNGDNSIVQNIRLDTDEQYLINHVFSEASRAMLESFLLEKQYGILANSVKARQIFDAKTVGYLGILSRLYPVLHQSAVGWEKNKRFVIAVFMFGQLVDDVIDFWKDLNKQTNMAVSIAYEFYPNEFVTLNHIYPKSPKYNLWIVFTKARRTSRHITKISYEFISVMFSSRPFLSIFIFAGVVWHILHKK